MSIMKNFKVTVNYLLPDGRPAKTIYGGIINPDKAVIRSAQRITVNGNVHPPDAIVNVEEVTVDTGEDIVNIEEVTVDTEEVTANIEAV